MKWIFFAFVVLLLLRAAGKAKYARVPKGGINESMILDVNGTKQWLNIYGTDRTNPVLLYLHGGPGEATSHIDYAFTRKWADAYTVVTWDQRNCGKSFDCKQNSTPLSKELFLADGKAVTDFVLRYLSKEKLTVFGHSWGSIYGANLVQEYPHCYDCFIGAGQLVDFSENEAALLRQFSCWAQNDSETQAIIDTLDPQQPTPEYFQKRNQLLEKFGYGMMAKGRDYNLALTLLFNPNYSLQDWLNFFHRDMAVYFDFLASEELKAFSLKGKNQYAVPYYNINGDRDFQTNYQLAQAYFEQITAPHKQLFLMENMTHGLLESDSEAFSAILHQIAAIQRKK